MITTTTKQIIEYTQNTHTHTHGPIVGCAAARRNPLVNQIVWAKVFVPPAAAAWMRRSWKSRDTRLLLLMCALNVLFLSVDLVLYTVSCLFLCFFVFLCVFLCFFVFFWYCRVAGFCPVGCTKCCVSIACACCWRSAARCGMPPPAGDMSRRRRAGLAAQSQCIFFLVALLLFCFHHGCGCVCSP